MLALPGGVKGSWFCLLTACSASTAAAGNLSKPFPPSLFPSVQQTLQTLGWWKAAFQLSWKTPLAKWTLGWRVLVPDHMPAEETEGGSFAHHSQEVSLGTCLVAQW